MGLRITCRPIVYMLYRVIDLLIISRASIFANNNLIEDIMAINFIAYKQTAISTNLNSGFAFA